DAVQAVDVTEVAVRGAVAMAVAVAVDPQIVVPLEIVRLDLIDQPAQPIDDVLARGGVGETNLAGVIRSVIAPAGGEPRFVDTGRSANRQVHAFGFDPHAELHAERVRVIAQWSET